MKLAEAMDVARKSGMATWMTPRELLSIGVDGVRAIAATNLKDTGYKALREGSFYEAKDVVAFAKHAKLRGFDAEKAAHATEDLIQAQPADQQRPLAEIIKEFDHAAAASYGNPADAAARQRLEEAGQRQKAALQAIADKGPEDAERVRKFQEDKKLEAQWQANVATHAAKAGVKVVTADAKVVTADAKVVTADAKVVTADAKVAAAGDMFGAEAPPDDSKTKPIKAAVAAPSPTKTAEVKIDDKTAAPKGSAPAQPKPS